MYIKTIFIILSFANFTFAALPPLFPQTGNQATTSCVIKTGALICWGNGTSGQLGDGTLTDTPLPQIIIPTGVTQVSFSVATTCAVVAGALKCWGDNAGKLFGDNTTTDSTIPKTIISSGVTQIALGNAHACAVIGGKVKCWGDNSMGQLGDGTTNANSPNLPKLVATGSGTITQLRAGANHTCAMVGTVLKCWGDNSQGQLGDGTANVSGTLLPATVPGTTGTKQIKTGDEHNCALVGTVLKCWGRNDEGQIGNDDTTDVLSPTTIYETGVTQVESGFQHTCAIRYGALKCWGDNSAGQIGNGSTGGISQTPETIIGLNVTQLTLGAIHSCALAGGTLQCWGGNTSGQLGDGTTTDSDVPVDVLL